jgi:hypothetical protein
LHSGENFDILFIFRLEVVVLGCGFVFCGPLLPLFDGGSGAKSKEMPVRQQGLEVYSKQVLECNNKGGGGIY